MWFSISLLAKWTTFSSKTARLAKEPRGSRCLRGRQYPVNLLSKSVKMHKYQQRLINCC